MIMKIYKNSSAILVNFSKFGIFFSELCHFSEAEFFCDTASHSEFGNSALKGLYQYYKNVTRFTAAVDQITSVISEFQVRFIAFLARRLFYRLVFRLSSITAPK